MDYKKIKTHIDLKFNKKFKYIMSIFCIVVFLLISFISPVLVSASSSNYSESNKILFHVKILNYSLPTLQVASKDSEYSTSLKHRFFQRIGLGDTFPKAVIKKEISMMKKDDDKDKKEEGNVDEVYNKDGDAVVDPFKLNDKDIFKDNDVSHQDNISPAYDPKLKKQLNMNKPEVLIYHTHTCESYKPGKASTDDQSVNICAAGDVFANELMQNYGISVIHDKTIYNYNKCYSSSGVTVDKYLKKYGDFKLVIDLHRDSESNKNYVVTKLNGEDVARYMFVVDKSNPKYKNTMEVVNKLIPISDKLYPNLIRSKKICEYNHGSRHFNQNKTEHSILIELGSYVNTTEEAKRTAKYLGRIIAEYINGK